MTFSSYYHIDNSTSCSLSSKIKDNLRLHMRYNKPTFNAYVSESFIETLPEFTPGTIFGNYKDGLQPITSQCTMLLNSVYVCTSGPQYKNIQDAYGRFCDNPRQRKMYVAQVNNMY